MKILGLIIVIAFGLGLFYVTGNFPDWGDPHSPASVHLSPHYIEKTMEETSVPNIVTAVLADYRGFDTMFETAVIFTAAMACFFLLRVLRAPRRKDETLYYHLESGAVLRFKNCLTLPPDVRTFKRVESTTTPYNLIPATMTRLLVPFIQIFALYVVAHGHHSPGGGFQGGVILGASFILLGVSTDLRTLCERFQEKALMLFLASGVLLYVTVGTLCMVYGGNFLDYAALAPLLRVDPIMARSLGILFVETGVAMTVMATMILIYNYVSSRGVCERGL